MNLWIAETGCFRCPALKVPAFAKGAIQMSSSRGAKRLRVKGVPRTRCRVVGRDDPRQGSLSFESTKGIIVRRQVPLEAQLAPRSLESESPATCDVPPDDDNIMGLS